MVDVSRLKIEPRGDDDAAVLMQAPTLDGEVHFSDLKRMALSPAHFRASVAEEFESTRVMRVGNCAHFMVLGPSKVKPLVRYRGGDRKGNAWKDFEAAELKKDPRAEIVTDKEWGDAKHMAAAVLADPCARKLLDGARFEVPMSWEDGGIKCATRGLDIVGPRWVADLKFTSCTEPQAFMRHATKLLYPQQMAFYEGGCILNGIDISEGIFLIGCESSPPYAVTCLRMPERVLQHGRKSNTIWLERLRSCRENDHWPAYTQSVIDFELPHWLDEGEEEAAA